MIGIGKWRGNVNSKFFTGSVDFEIIDNNGKYEFDIALPEKFSNMQFSYYDIAEKGNTLTCKGKCSLIPRLTVRAELKFSGDTASIKLSAPPVPGAIKIDNARKIG